jgi:hypothetical protein
VRVRLFVCRCACACERARASVSVISCLRASRCVRARVKAYVRVCVLRACVHTRACAYDQRVCVCWLVPSLPRARARNHACLHSCACARVCKCCVCSREEEPANAGRNRIVENTKNRAHVRLARVSQCSAGTGAVGRVAALRVMEPVGRLTAIARAVRARVRGVWGGSIGGARAAGLATRTLLHQNRALHSLGPSSVPPPPPRATQYIICRFARGGRAARALPGRSPAAPAHRARHAVAPQTQSRLTSQEEIAWK